MTRPNETVLDRAALGPRPGRGGRDGRLPAARAAQGTGDGTVVLQESAVTYAFVEQALPLLEKDGIDPCVYYVASAELFDLLPRRASRRGSSPRSARARRWASPASRCRRCTAGSSPTAAARTRSTRSRKGHFLGSGQGEMVLAEAGLDGASQARRSGRTSRRASGLLRRSSDRGLVRRASPAGRSPLTRPPWGSPSGSRPRSRGRFHNGPALLDLGACQHTSRDPACFGCASRPREPSGCSPPRASGHGFPAWEPEYDYPPSVPSVPVAGTVFRPPHDGRATVWPVIAYDENGAVDYARHTHGSLRRPRPRAAAGRGPDYDVDLAYRLTSLSPDGDRVLAAMSAAACGAMLQHWAAAMHEVARAS